MPRLVQVPGVVMLLIEVLRALYDHHQASSVSMGCAGTLNGEGHTRIASVYLHDVGASLFVPERADVVPDQVAKRDQMLEGNSASMGTMCVREAGNPPRTGYWEVKPA